MKCPRCGKNTAEQTTKRNVLIATCPKAEGGCGAFINLGHVKKEANGNDMPKEQQSTKAKETGAGADAGTGQSATRRTGKRPDAKRPAKRAKRPDGRQQLSGQPVQRTEKPVEQRPEKRGILARLCDSFSDF